MAKRQTKQDATRTRQKNKLPAQPDIGKDEKLFAGERPLYDSRRDLPFPRSETVGLLDRIGEYIEELQGYIPTEEERKQKAEELIAQYTDAGLSVPPELLSAIGMGELASMLGEVIPTEVII